MIFKAKFFNELTNKELFEIVRARQEIFLMEQKIICREFDETDYESLHCFFEENEKVIAYLRAYRDEKYIHIGRVLTITHGKGHGKDLMKLSVPTIRSVFGVGDILIHA